MEGPGAGRRRFLHVERTAEPSVLRWVCHRPDLDATPVPPERSTLTDLQRTGSLSFVVVTNGDLLVGFPDAGLIADKSVLDAVDRAVVDALDMPGWSAPSGESIVSLRSRGKSRQRRRPETSDARWQTGPTDSD